MAGGVVEFIPADFRAAYPDFSSVSDATLNLYFNQACLLLSNKPSSAVKDLEERKTLLWMLVAHFCYIYGGQNGTDSSSVGVGRVSSASEGSVSVSFDAGTVSANASWYMQSPFGFSYWNFTAKYRMVRYMPGASGPAVRYGFVKTRGW